LSLMLDEVGSAVFSLNTAVVGLDAVEKGHRKPETLDISWDPKDRMVAARKSRRFILEAVLVRVAEAVNQYCSAVGRTCRLSSVAAKWNGNTKTTEKIADVGKELVAAEDAYLTIGAQLLVHWRNKVVHTRSNAKLTGVQENVLKSKAAFIRDNYANLDILQLLNHFQSSQPTLKDISSLISMSIRYSRSVDTALHACVGREDVEEWLRWYDLSDELRRIRHGTKPDKVQVACERLIQTKVPALLASYRQYCN
jgi:hypothetical protein